jgi:hypothetical protein
MQPVVELNNNDVLFGRGMRASMYIGTQKFRDICEERKNDYLSATKNATKRAIAQEVIDTVKENGGRFLKQQEGNTDDHEEVWYEVTNESDVLAKAKQALRQQHGRKRDVSSDDNVATDANLPFACGSSSEAVSGFLNNSSISTASFLSPSMAPDTVSLPVTIAAVDPCLPLFQAQLWNPYLQASLMDPILAAPTVRPVAGLPAFAPLSAPQQEQLLHQPMFRFSSKQQVPEPRPLQQQFLGCTLAQFDSYSDDDGHRNTPNDVNTKELPETDEIPTINESSDQNIYADDNTESESIPMNDEDLEEFFLSVVQLSGLPRFTNHAEERANMTDDEKAAALSDMFGKYCNVDIQKSKRTRRDLDPESIAFLVKRMRDEIERVPAHNRTALIEAQEKCGEEEFSDERLERFLRCEKMNAQLAAIRFVRYWQERRELFGPEKFTNCMSIDGALCDDVIAIEKGWMQLLPKLDASGRQLMYLEPARHDKEGYTSESLLRAAWYVIEVACRSNKDIDSGVVQLVWGENSTVWDYDQYLHRRINDFESTCWPCRFDCFHCFSETKFLFHIFRPIVSALQSKESRARTVWHSNVPGRGILPVLSEYGITGDMVPTELGGTIQLNPSEWVAHRRAIEMEEL